MQRVIVSVKSIQRNQDGEDHVIELVTSGKYYEKARAKIIVYDETEVTGLQGTKTTIKVYDDSVVLLRTGASEMRNEYITGQMYEFEVETPVGNIPFGVKTHNITSTIENGVGTVHLEYDISFNGEWAYYNQLMIDIREDTNYGNEGDLKARN